MNFIVAVFMFSIFVTFVIIWSGAIGENWWHFSK